MNPLVPQYKLPTAQSSEPPQPKFIRDAHNVGDIEGTRPKPLYRFAMRNNGTVDDIDGAQASWKPRHQQARLNSQPLDFNLNVSDINNNGFRVRLFSLVLWHRNGFGVMTTLSASLHHSTVLGSFVSDFLVDATSERPARPAVPRLRDGDQG